MAVTWHNEQVVNIAPTECGASCVMTALNMLGKDTAFFLLDYWNISYKSGLLFSSKSLRLLNLDYMYGVRFDYSLGDWADIEEWLDERLLLIVECRASRLAFFSRENLVLEDNNVISHYILLHGREGGSRSFLVTDPIAGYEGAMTWEELSRASVEPGRVLAFRLKDSHSSFLQPPGKELFCSAVARNGKLYKSMAISSFARDLERSLQWTPDKRNKWLDSNKITITSIIKLRNAVWNCCCKTDLFDGRHRAEGAAQVAQITKTWTLINFLLIKYGRKPEGELVHALTGKLELVRRQELDFLNSLEELAHDLATD
ncbi:MAG: hypothetical protein K0R57_614 [Paenibacillaceae bacterium]|jgi:hypothetical protein|nr:hypothetical protein [Paenibacillaceae bacterium]